jgi:hypothetical protein
MDGEANDLNITSGDTLKIQGGSKLVIDSSDTDVS